MANLIPTFPLDNTIYGFSVHKIPTFASLLPKGSPAGRTVRSFQQTYPVWAFELRFNFLRDSTQNIAPYAPYALRKELQAIEELFLWCQAKRGLFYFDDPTDDSRLHNYVATGDGVTTDFLIPRTVSPSTTLLNAATAGQTTFHINLARALAVGDFVMILQGGVRLYAGTITTLAPAGFPNTVVCSAPGISSGANVGAFFGSQLAVFEPIGALNTTQASAFYLNGVLAASNTYAINLNKISFNTAPAAGVNITGDYWFYYLCRFAETSQQYKQFLKNLWELGSCKFLSRITPLTNISPDYIVTEISHENIITEISHEPMKQESA